MASPKAAGRAQHDLKMGLQKVRHMGLAPFARLRSSMPKSYTGEHYGRWLARQHEVASEVAAKLRAEGATIDESGGSVRFSFMGIRTSSTMGLGGALRNWKGRAEALLKAR